MVLLLKIKKFLVMHVDDLFDERIQPEQNKQLVPKPPTYEESFADKIKEGKICLQNIVRIKFLIML